MVCEDCEKLALRVRELESVVAELKARLAWFENANVPSSQSKPFLSKTARRRLVEDKKSGRSDGHKGSGRESPTKIDERVKLKSLKVCPHCGGKVKRRKGHRKRTVSKLVRGSLKNTEYDIPSSYCLHCHKNVEPVVPNALPNARFDLSFAVYIACLKILGVSLEKTRFLLKTDYRLSVSKGTLVNTMNNLAVFLGEDYENLRRRLNRSKRVHGDETGWGIHGKNHWLWEFVSERTAFFTVERSRGRSVPQKILDRFKGVLTTDFWGPYNAVDCEKQKCWAHLIRDLVHVLEFNPSDEFAEFATGLLLLYEHGKTGRKSKEKRRFLEGELDKLLSQKYTDPNCLRLFKRLMRHRSELFTFCERKGVVSHNNFAERMIRPSVVIRKNAFGSQSERGAQTFATLMSFFQTSQLNNQNYPEYLEKLAQNRLEN
jgi:transposase